MLAQLLHRGEWVFRRVFLGRLISLPLYKSTAHGVILLLEDQGVPGHQLDRHGVGMGEIALSSIKNDVFERGIDGLRSELHRERLIRLIAQAIEKGGSTVAGSFPTNPASDARSVP